MAEAFGTVAAAMQLAAIVKDIWEFYRDIKDAPKEIVGLRKSLKDLECLLASVETTFQTSSATNIQLDQTIHIIRANIQEISAKTPLNDKSKSLKERIKWVLSNKAVAKDMTTQVESAKLSLAIILQSITQNANTSLLDMFASQMNSQSLMLSALCRDFRKFVTASQTTNSAAGNISASSISQIRHQDMGYRLTGNDNFSIMHPLGVLQVTISHYQAENQSGEKPAMNTTMRLIPKKQLFGVQKFLQLQYLEVQHQYKLPDPRPKLKVLSIRPSDSPIFCSVVQNNLPMMRYLLASGQASIYDQDEDGYGLLHYATLFHNFELVETLLQEGIDPTVQDFDSCSPIRILSQNILGAIYNGISMEGLMGCFRALIRHTSGSFEYFCEFDSKVSHLGLRLIYCASNKTWDDVEKSTVFWNQVSAWIQFLSEIGVDTSGVDNLLLTSAAYSRTDVYNPIYELAISLNLGANITARNSSGMQALHLTFDPWTFSPVEGHGDSTLKMIVEKGIRIVSHAMERDIDIISAIDNLGLTPWDYAVSNRYVREYRSVMRACKVNSSILEAEHSYNEWHSWFMDDTNRKLDYGVPEALVVDIQEDVEQPCAIAQSLSLSLGSSKSWDYKEVDFMGERIEVTGELPEDIWPIISNVAWKATIAPIISRTEAVAFLISFVLLSVGVYMKHGILFLLSMLSKLYIHFLQVLRS